MLFAMSAVAAVLAAGTMTQRANAAPLGNPGALPAAVDDISVVDSVHCRPGWRHHEPNRWRRADGCRRVGGVIVVPGRERFVIRDGVRVRVGAGSRTSIRSRTTIRSGGTNTTRSNTTVREGSGGTTQSGDRGGRTTGTGKGTGQGKGSGQGTGGGQGSQNQQNPGAKQ
jgi:hypothetical protein